MERDKRRGPSSVAGRRRRNRIAGQFTALLTDILESPSWRVLSLSARRVLDRISNELRHHGGFEGDGLCVTYADFQAYGIERHAIPPAIREAVALGFLRITREGYGGNSEFRRPTLYKLTYLNTVDGEPTHAWKRIRSVAEAQMKAREARAARRPSKNRKPVRDSFPTPVRESRTETWNFPVRESRTPVVGESRTTLDSMGEVQRTSVLEPGATTPSVRPGPRSRLAAGR